MINRVGPASPTRIGQVTSDKAGPVASTEAATPINTAATGNSSLVAALAEAGPPINADKIRAISQAIAAGQYPLDAKAIAAKMVALDLPQGQE